MATARLATVYATAVRNPKRTKSNIIEAMPIDGEAIKNDMAVPVSTPAVKRPAKIGTVVHEQNGVSDPKIEAVILPPIPFILISLAWNFSIIGCVLTKRPRNDDNIINVLMITMKPKKYMTGLYIRMKCLSHHKIDVSTQTIAKGTKGSRY